MINLKKIFHRTIDYSLKVPLRIAPFGAYLDCYNGTVTGLAINKFITLQIAFNSNSTMRVHSAEAEQTFVWETSDFTKMNSWVDYCKGAIAVIKDKFKLTAIKGFDCLIIADLPSGLGLASSAALSIGCVYATLMANGLTKAVKLTELLELAQRVETNFVGVSCGKMDFACEIFGRENQLMSYDCSTDKIFYSKKHPKFLFAFIYSPIRHVLSESTFNASVRNKTDKQTIYLTDEEAAVKSSMMLWNTSNVKSFAELMSASGRSFELNWGVDSDTTKTLLAEALAVNGVYGARYSGSGIGGGILALVNPAALRRLKKLYANTGIKVEKLRCINGFWTELAPSHI